MKKSRRIVKKMSKKSLINKKALRYIIANSNLCKHAIREYAKRQERNTMQGDRDIAGQLDYDS